MTNSSAVAAIRHILNIARYQAELMHRAGYKSPVAAQRYQHATKIVTVRSRKRLQTWQRQ